MPTGTNISLPGRLFALNTLVMNSAYFSTYFKLSQVLELQQILTHAGADPGFPVGGGANPREGGANI